MGVVIPADSVVVLDIDDTLYLERDYVRSGFRAVGRLLAARGVEGAGDELWAGFEAGVRHDAFDRLLSGRGMTPEPGLVGELVDCYRHHHPDIGLLPDAECFLGQLAGRPAAAITDGPLQSQRAKAAALGLGRWLDPVVLTADLGPGRSKPHHAAYELLERHFGMPAERCWYVGDNPVKDFVAPLQRGWSAVRIRRPLSLHEALDTPEGITEVGSFGQIALGVPPSDRSCQ